MVPNASPFLAAFDAAEIARSATIAVVALVVLVLGLGIGAFIILFRRGGDRGIRGSGSRPDLDSQAAALLVTLDDRVRDAENEVGFAEAQFGRASASDFDAALARARLQLVEAFRLGQQRDSTASDAGRLHRRTTLQMIALCQTALASLDRFHGAFAQLRRTEVDAAQTVGELRAKLGVLQDRLVHAKRRHEQAAEDYLESALAGAAQQIADGEALVNEIGQQLDVAVSRISPTGVNAVADLLHSAAAGLHGADQQLDEAEFVLGELAAAVQAVSRMREASAGDLREARIALDGAPDPDTGANIVSAIAAVEKSLTATTVDPGVRSNPFSQLAILGDAAADLDAALATARNQQQRFDHARAAYEGTLIAARSQIGVVRELIVRGNVGARARTRLAEAERQLMIAEAETDPVEALDAIRRSVTHARDADALARY